MKHRLILMLGLLAVSLGIVAGSAFAYGGRDGDGDHHGGKPTSVTFCVNGTTMVLKARDDNAELFTKALMWDKTVYVYSIVYGDHHKSYTKTFYSFFDHMKIDHHFYKGTPISLASGACSGPVGDMAVIESGVFLCYSAYQDTPGVWPSNEAKGLFDEGYWPAYAVSGNVAGGTNIGDYHLTCNLAAAQSVSDTLVGGDGTTVGSDYSGVIGFYPVVGQ